MASRVSLKRQVTIRGVAVAGSISVERVCADGRITNPSRVKLESLTTDTCVVITGGVSVKAVRAEGGIVVAGCI